MPRIRDSRGDPFDFCARCMPSEELAEATFAGRGAGPDGRGNCYAYNDDHPDYQGEGYKCGRCGRTLDHRDD